MDKILLRYEGRFDFIPGENRIWTLLSHFQDQSGADRFRSTFSLEGLQQIGVVKQSGMSKTNGVK